MKRLPLIVAVFVLFSLSMTAGASTITWDLVNVAFTDGGTAAGTITIDTTLGAATAVNISVTGGNTTNFPAFTYNIATPPPAANGVGNGLQPTDTVFNFFSPDPSTNLNCTGLTPTECRRLVIGVSDTILTQTSGSLNIVTMTAFDTSSGPQPQHYSGEYHPGSLQPPGGNSVFRYISGGSLQAETAAMPEPSSLIFLGSGILALSLRRKKSYRYGK